MYTKLHPEERRFIRILKEKYRSGWLLRGIPENKCETVGAHTIKVARAVNAYKRREDFDRDRAFSIAIIHDVAECIIPDYTPQDKITKAEKHEIEINAIRQLTRGLGEAGENIFRKWLEYDAGKTVEANIVKQLDKLDTVVQALEYEKQGYQVQEFYPYARERIHDPQLIAIFNELVRNKTSENNYRRYFRLLRTTNN